VKNPPEYRSFRFGVWAVYIVVAGYLGLCASVSTYVGARKRMGAEPPPAALASVDAAALRGCMADLEKLYTELTERMEATLQSTRARSSSEEWEDWSPQWRQRVLDVGSRCRLEQGDVNGAEPMHHAWHELLALHRHYTTLAVQFSKEIGPFAERMRQTMAKARSAVP
jgi:hypothetical protein